MLLGSLILMVPAVGFVFFNLYILTWALLNARGGQWPQEFKSRE